MSDCCFRVSQQCSSERAEATFDPLLELTLNTHSALARKEPKRPALSLREKHPPLFLELAARVDRRDRAGTLSAPRTNIGVLVDTLDQDYQRRILLGIEDEAELLGLRITCFAIGDATEPDIDLRFALCSPSRVDAVVVLAGTFARGDTLQALTEYCEQLGSTPLCSIGGSLPRAVEVTVDSRSGMLDALTHLTRSCGRGRIAFVRGPRDNDEAEERYQAYLDAMVSLQITVDEDLVVEGDFLERSGRQAVCTLLDDRRQGFDAVLAANDLMALGAMKELLTRRVAVPEKVAVVGFDDIQAASFTDPPLATVRQPLYEQGRRALREVVARLSETTLPNRVVMSATFVPRSSCGARTLSSYVAGLGPPQGDPAATGSGIQFEEAYRRALPSIIGELRSVLHQADFAAEDSLAETLLTQASTDILGQRRGLLQRRSFVVFLEDTIRSMDAAPGAYTSSWQEVITVMHRQFGPCLRDDARLRRRAEGIWHRSRSSISYLAERNQASKWLSEVTILGSIRDMNARLLRCHSLAELAQQTAVSLQALGVPGCFVAQKTASGSYQGVFLIRNGQVQSDLSGDFSPQRLAPSFSSSEEETEEADSNQFAQLLKPLTGHPRHVGYIVFEKGPHRSHLYSTVRDTLSAALKLVESSSERPENEHHEN